MHPYYGVSQLNSAQPIPISTVGQLSTDDPREQTNLPVETYHLDLEHFLSSIHTQPSQPFENRGTATTMNNLGSGFNFPNPLPQQLPPYSTGYVTTSSINNGHNFQFLNPTFSSPPVQMMAPGTHGYGNLSMWQHSIPSTMPWAPPRNSPIGQYKFSATPLTTALATTEAAIPAGASSLPVPGTSNFGYTNGFHHLNCSRKQKRKAQNEENSQEDSAPGSKIFINEERMAERLEQLQLDNNNLQWHPNLEEDWCSHHPPRQNQTLEEIDSRLSISEDEEGDKDLENDNSSKGEEPKLEFSELLKMGLKTKDILPQVLLDELNKPCMQVVLWKPPGDLVREATQLITKPDNNSDSQQVAGEVSCNGHEVDMQDAGLPTAPALPVWEVPKSQQNGPSLDIDEDPMDL